MCITIIARTALLDVDDVERDQSDFKIQTMAWKSIQIEHEIHWMRMNEWKRRKAKRDLGMVIDAIDHNSIMAEN